MSYKDKTWCASPQCKDKCGRKMLDKDRKLVEALGQDAYVSYAYFCGYPDDMPMLDKLKAKFNSTFSK